MGTYLTGSCMACSHDQQWEKRWNMLGSPARRDGLSSAPTKRAAWLLSVLRPPARACSPWWVGSISSQRTPSHSPALLPPAWCIQAKPGDKSQPPEQHPAGTDTPPQPNPALPAPSCIAGAPVGLLPARPHCASPAHIPFV